VSIDKLEKGFTKAGDKSNKNIYKISGKFKNEVMEELSLKEDKKKKKPTKQDTKPKSKPKRKIKK
nr:hypothetical protein [Nitrosopumilus sp.]